MSFPPFLVHSFKALCSSHFFSHFYSTMPPLPLCPPPPPISFPLPLPSLFLSSASTDRHAFPCQQWFILLRQMSLAYSVLLLPCFISTHFTWCWSRLKPAGAQKNRSNRRAAGLPLQRRCDSLLSFGRSGINTRACMPCSLQSCNWWSRWSWHWRV